MSIHQATDEIIAFLNECVSIDRHAIQELMSKRVPCNENLGNHPTIQVAYGDEKESKDIFIRPGEFRVGFLGILNGFCGIYENNSGPIQAIYKDGFLTGFERTPNGDS